MKNKFLLLILSYLLVGQVFCQDKQTLNGRIASNSNPCFTVPCLPGIVFAFRADTSVFILSINKNWVWAGSPLIINGETFNSNDAVKIIGSVCTKYDNNNSKYNEIEVDSAFHIVTSIAQMRENSIFIYPNSSEGTITVKSGDFQINRVEIISIDGEILYSCSNIETNNLIIKNFREKGIFILNILLDDNGILTRKILIQ